MLIAAHEEVRSLTAGAFKFNVQLFTGGFVNQQKIVAAVVLLAVGEPVRLGVGLLEQID
ncbi:hypothetical protein D3C71_1962810 [compost metagenome]